MKKFFIIIATAALATVFLVCFLWTRGSEEKLRDGYYSATETDYYYGWMEFITIYVNNGKIVTCEYNAKNTSGLNKSWDMDYMRHMNAADGNYPDRYVRNYSNELLARQSTDGIDAMSGATESHTSFIKLAEAALRQAASGDFSMAFVKVERN